MGIHGDGLKAERDWGVSLGGQVDLSDMALDRGICRSDISAKWSLAGQLRQYIESALDIVCNMLAEWPQSSSCIVCLRACVPV